MFAIAPVEPVHNPVFALIIGVSDYSAYEPSGSLDLPGATNDAESWASYCKHTLNLSDENFQTLSDADGAEATSRASIIAGLKWLGEQLGKQEGVNNASALLTYSGHGLTVEHAGDDNLAEGLSLALAPSDIGPDLEAALLFSHIEEILFNAVAYARFGTTVPTGEQEAEVYAILENVTAVFDACYSRPKASQAVIRSLSEGGPTPKLPELKVFSRLVLGAHLWETAYEIQTAGVWHGAFTYAFVTMLEQWRVQTDAQTPVWYSRAAYGDVVFRARNLISTLGMPEQTPTLLGSQNNLALVSFLRPGKEINPDWTSVEPDGPRRREEFSAENNGVQPANDKFTIEFLSGSTTWAYFTQNGSVQKMYFDTSFIKDKTSIPSWKYRVDSGTCQPKPTGWQEVTPPAASWSKVVENDGKLNPDPTRQTRKNSTVIVTQSHGGSIDDPGGEASYDVLSYAMQIEFTVATGSVDKVFLYMKWDGSSTPVSSNLINLNSSTSKMMGNQSDTISAPGTSTEGWYYISTST